MFLSVKPGIDILSIQNDMEESCCAGQCKSTDSDIDEIPCEADENDPCSGKSCNPFQGCCSFNLYCSSNSYINFSPPEKILQINFIYQSTFHSLYETDCWQPPKIV